LENQEFSGIDFGSDQEEIANLMICLIYKETYLLDQLLRAQEQKFIKDGGFRENLFKKRREYRGF
jgi:four helix bundle suffix protein